MKRKKKRTDRHVQVGSVSRSGRQTLKSYRICALPILNRIIARSGIEKFLGQYVREDDRCTIPPSVGTVVLLKNFLTSRQPIYGVGEWACCHAPEQLGLSEEEVRSLNDDRVGRCLDRLFEADRRSLLLATITHVIKEFGVSLDELHNDSTTITFSGEYKEASERLEVFGKPTRLITWGHNKDHRPDLKQLLYTLTVTEDGSGQCQLSTDPRSCGELKVREAGEVCVLDEEYLEFVVAVHSGEKMREARAERLSDDHLGGGSVGVHRS